MTSRGTCPVRAAIASCCSLGWTNSTSEWNGTPGMSWGEHAGTLRAEQQLSHQAHAPARRRSPGDIAAAFKSQLQGAPGGLQPVWATGPADRTSSSERPVRTRPCRSPAGGQPTYSRPGRFLGVKTNGQEACVRAKAPPFPCEPRSAGVGFRPRALKEQVGHLPLRLPLHRATPMPVCAPPAHFDAIQETSK